MLLHNLDSVLSNKVSQGQQRCLEKAVCPQLLFKLVSISQEGLSGRVLASSGWLPRSSCHQGAVVAPLLRLSWARRRSQRLKPSQRVSALALLGALCCPLSPNRIDVVCLWPPSSPLHTPKHTIFPRKGPETPNI